ncbi:hypothetical protein ABH935_006646 [Catenulispora sp. GAS73]|uniref:transposase n=1 Tax=Catenulispora sp. GAS73 TaxID=3156269 RepID=UPI00351248D6
MSLPDVASAAAGTGKPEQIRLLRSTLRAGFLAEAGWNEADQVMAPPRDHRLLGLRECAVVNCTAGIRKGAAVLCRPCQSRYVGSGLGLEEFAAVPADKSSRGHKMCRVPNCERAAVRREGWCRSHHDARVLRPRLSAEEFAALASPLPGFGRCRVASCSRLVDTSSLGLCAPHWQRWARHRDAHPDPDFENWLARCDPIVNDSVVIMKGLPEQVRLELLAGVQVRTDAGTKTPLTALRSIVAALRETQAASIHGLDPEAIKGSRHDAHQLLRSLKSAVRLRLATPDSERAKDVWDLAVFGTRGFLRFTGISQPWLRDVAKHWAEEDLPRHRGRQSGAKAKTVVAAVSRLSASLADRNDRGVDPGTLGRSDIVALMPGWPTNSGPGS